ncbi:hypothetical protein [Streptomyces iconiensis]|uniref:Uncharacterized protein n=1 Tax=Streptomyces iconiensis TaxID=1384038 RepID=A0ABT7A5Q2_9ACTN|nr:hypothetical protein [Streptomyces iconiensis]MDJ1136650.1 hypothetical protein [Streptomyces iconiensis]
MSELMTITKMTGHSVVYTCLLGSRLYSTGVSGVVPGGNERPTKAPAVAAAQAQARADVFAVAVNGAGEGHQKTQHQTMWAFRGLEPWRDPA